MRRKGRRGGGGRGAQFDALRDYFRGIQISLVVEDSSIVASYTHLLRMESEAGYMGMLRSWSLDTNR